jgi:predicted transcriptional regulator
VQKHFNKNVVQQYQQEERTLMARRIIASKDQLSELLKSLENEQLSQTEKIKQLKSEIFAHFDMNTNEEITSMAQIVRKVLEKIAEISL